MKLQRNSVPAFALVGLVLGAARCTGAIDGSGGEDGQNLGGGVLAPGGGKGTTVGPGMPGTPGGSGVGGAAGASPVGGPPPMGTRPRTDTDPYFLFAPAVERGFPGVRLLTSEELAHAIKDLTGVEPDITRLPDAPKLLGLANDAGQVRVRDASHLKELLVIATQVAAQADLAATVPCPDAAAGCTLMEVTALLRRAFLQPVTDATAQRFLAIYKKARTEGDHDFGRRALLQAVLYAPGFLYRTELGAPNSNGRLTPLELAVKLSFFLWGTAPDPELRRVASDGTLTQEAVYGAAIDRLLKDPRTERQMYRLVYEWLALEELDLTAKADAAKLPSSLRGDLLEEVRMMVSQLVKVDGALPQLFTTRESWMNGTTAALYGVTAIKTPEFQKVSLDAVKWRRGILTTGAVLAAHAKESGRSPMQRGKFLTNDLFCHGFPSEAGVAAMQLPAGDGSQPFRDKFLPLEVVSPCNNCHKTLNAGFAFDVFDHAGRRYSSTVVAEAEARGSFDLPPYNVVKFTNPHEAIEAFAAHPALGRCFVTQAWRLAQGRLPGARDTQALEEVERGYYGAGQRVLRAFATIARSESFRAVAPSR